MPCRLSKEEIVTLQVLKSKEQTNVEIAETLGITEGAVRYHLKRAKSGAADGRQNKEFKAEAFSEVIDSWFEAKKEEKRPVNVRDLYDHLVEQQGYPWSYKSLLRYVRHRYPRPRIRTYRRVETPPGAQSQTDWGEFPAVDIGRGPEPLSAFFMTLSHSRMPSVIWRRRKDQLSWLESHNESFERLGGVAATYDAEKGVADAMRFVSTRTPADVIIDDDEGSPGFFADTSGWAQQSGGVLSTNANGRVAADAVKFVRESD